MTALNKEINEFINQLQNEDVNVNDIMLICDSFIHNGFVEDIMIMLNMCFPPRGSVPFNFVIEEDKEHLIIPDFNFENFIKEYLLSSGLKDSDFVLKVTKPIKVAAPKMKWTIGGSDVGEIEKEQDRKVGGSGVGGVTEMLSIFDSAICGIFVGC
jgi:hypothetical protein